MDNTYSVFWFRRDLRLDDNAGLYHALKAGKPVLPLFIFDSNILESLDHPNDARVDFIHQTVSGLKQALAEIGSDLIVRYGKPEEVWAQLITQYRIAEVYVNRDYEPYARQRDTSVQIMLQKNDISFRTFKDHVIFEFDEVLKDDGKPYTVFTPYSHKWLSRLSQQTSRVGELATSFYLKPYPSDRYSAAFAPMKTKSPMPALEDMGFTASGFTFPSKTVKQGIIRHYDQTRDIPALDEGTSHLGIHFRFGTISIREKAAKAAELNKVFLNELIWRDFYSQILAHFPHVVTRPFKPAYEAIEWVNNQADFERWCKGKTGYPIVDAGMRQLNVTGYMHNRVRMITASFLTKHLLIDWRWGEAYFASKLLDFDLASNNGGWQWAAGCGTDAAPYFRVFNPTAQQEKFDKDFIYIKKWVPEWGTPTYALPMVDHKFARERCLNVYKKGLGA